MKISSSSRQKTDLTTGILIIFRGLNISDIDGNHVVNSNQNELTRIFNNLISNAIKFSHAGGDVSVKLEVYKNNTFTASIVDNGIGIVYDTIPQLFKKYSSYLKKKQMEDKQPDLDFL